MQTGDSHARETFLAAAYRAGLYREPTRDEIVRILNTQAEEYDTGPWKTRIDPRYLFRSSPEDVNINESELQHPSEMDQWAGDMLEWDNCLRDALPGEVFQASFYGRPLYGQDPEGYDWTLWDTITLEVPAEIYVFGYQIYGPPAEFKRWRHNPISEARILGSTILGIWGGGDENEAATARNIAIRMLSGAQIDELPEIKRVLQKAKERAKDQVGSEKKLRGIWEAVQTKSAAFIDVSFEEILGIVKPRKKTTKKTKKKPTSKKTTTRKKTARTYTRRRRYGTCQMDGCDNDSRGKPLCRKHYYEAIGKPFIELCQHPGCDQPSRGQPLCREHYYGGRRRPNPDEDIRALERKYHNTGAWEDRQKWARAAIRAGLACGEDLGSHQCGQPAVDICNLCNQPVCEHDALSHRTSLREGAPKWATSKCVSCDEENPVCCSYSTYCSNLYEDPVCVNCCQHEFDSARNYYPQRNPDEKTRILERKYKETGAASDLARYVLELRRAGEDKKADDAEYDHLWPFLDHFYTEYHHYDAGKFTLRDDPQGLQTRLDTLNEAKDALTAQARTLGISPSHYCYRPYHDIPYINTHLEELAFLQNATNAYAWRDDDSYSGHADFEHLQDAEEYKAALERQFPMSDPHIATREDLPGWKLDDRMQYRVTWRMYK